MASRRNWWPWVLFGAAVLIGSYAYYRRDHGPIVFDHGSIGVLVRDHILPPALIEDFERRTGINVRVTTFLSNHDLRLTLAHAKESIDLAMPSAYLAQILIEEKALTTINRQAVPNIDNVDRRFFTLDFDPQNNFAVPYLWGSVGIGYNRDRVTGLPKTWNFFFSHHHENGIRGKIAMIDDDRYTLGSALISLGYNPNRATAAQIKEAGQMIEGLSDELFDINSKDIVDIMEKGKVSMALAWAPDVTRAMLTNKHLRLALPMDGTLIFRFLMIIPRAAKNPTGAEKFLNFLLDSENAAAVTNYSLYPTTVLTSRPFLNRFILNGPSFFINPAGKNYHIGLEDPGTIDTFRSVWAHVRAPYRAHDPVPVYLDDE